MSGNIHLVESDPSSLLHDLPASEEGNEEADVDIRREEVASSEWLDSRPAGEEHNGSEADDDGPSHVWLESAERQDRARYALLLQSPVEAYIGESTGRVRTTISHLSRTDVTKAASAYIPIQLICEPRVVMLESQLKTVSAPLETLR